MKVKLSELKLLRDELQKILGKPKIKFDGDRKKFKKELIKASQSLTDDDELSKKSKKYLDNLLKKKKKGEKGKLSKTFVELLKSVADNLNDSLDLQPKINLESSPEELAEDIISASSLINRSDKDITETTREVIGALRENFKKPLIEVEKIFMNKEESVKTKEKIKESIKGSKREKKEEKGAKVVKIGRIKGGERNEFGFKIGSNRDLFCKSLVAKPKTMIEIQREKWNTSCETFYDSWKLLVERGFGVRTPEGVMKIVKKGTKK